MMKHLAIITTHPIQYNAPLFKLLAKSAEIDLKVFYTWAKGSGEKHDPGFGKKIEWDIPLLDGYKYMFVTNTSKEPGSHHFWGIQNPSLIDEIKNYRPNAILVYGWSFQSHLKVMRYFKGKIPVWFRGDSTLLDYDYKTIKEVFGSKSTVGSPPSTVKKAMVSYLKFRLRKIFLTWVYKHVDKAFYVGTNNKNYFLAHGLKEEQLVWLPHAVDNEFFQKEEVEVEAKKWRAALGIKEDDFVVLFAGKFEPKKNPELLVRAIIEMNEKVHSPRSTVHNLVSPKKSKTLPQLHNVVSVPPPLLGEVGRGLHLILVGSGILESKLKAMAHGKNYIHFLPFQNQTRMPMVYRLGDVFCLPSQGPGETWGLAVNEALACGRPVICSDKVGCAIDLVITNFSGYIYKSNSIADLIHKIQLVNKKEISDNCLSLINQWYYKPNCLIDQL